MNTIDIEIDDSLGGHRLMIKDGYGIVGSLKSEKITIERDGVVLFTDGSYKGYKGKIWGEVTSIELMCSTHFSHLWDEDRLSLFLLPPYFPLCNAATFYEAACETVQLVNNKHRVNKESNINYIVKTLQNTFRIREGI